MCKVSAARFTSNENQTEISDGLDALKIVNVWEGEYDDYAAHDRLANRTYQLAPMDCSKERDETAKVLFLTRAGARTQWVLVYYNANEINHHTTDFWKYYTHPCKNLTHVNRIQPQSSKKGGRVSAVIVETP